MKAAVISLIVSAIVIVGCSRKNPSLSVMTLSTDTNTKIDNPSKEQIRAAIEDAATRPADGFVILAQTKMTYVQAAGNSEKQFWIEYQEESRANHYHGEKRLPIDETAEILAAYARRDAGWKSATKWVSSR